MVDVYRPKLQRTHPQLPPLHTISRYLPWRCHARRAAMYSKAQTASSREQSQQPAHFRGAVTALPSSKAESLAINVIHAPREVVLGVEAKSDTPLGGRHVICLNHVTDSPFGRGTALNL